LPARVEIGLYRVAQEALTNAKRHARASTISIQLIVTPERIDMTIMDDGCGFDPTNIPDGHYGLIGLNERVRLLGGTVEICSAPDEGTRFAISVPLEA